MDSVEKYSMKILANHGCDCYTYGGEWAAKIMDDLKEEYPDGMEFPYIDVANAILAISRPKPIVREPWKMVFDTDNTTEGIGFDSFGAAKAAAEDTLIEWMGEERNRWKDAFHPTEEQLDKYNYMICNCSVSDDKYNPDTDEYETEWEPSYEDEEALCWKELSMEDIRKEEAACKEGLKQ